MKKILEFFKGLFSGWGIDKWAHLGIGNGSNQRNN